MRSASVSGIPRCILSLLAAEWKSSASANSHPSRCASIFPIVVFPDPVTPITITIIRSSASLISAQQQNHVEQDKHRDNNLHDEHAPFVELSDHEIVQLA